MTLYKYFKPSHSFKNKFNRIHIYLNNQVIDFHSQMLEARNEILSQMLQKIECPRNEVMRMFWKGESHAAPPFSRDTRFVGPDGGAGAGTGEPGENRGIGSPRPVLAGPWPVFRKSETAHQRTEDDGEQAIDLAQAQGIQTLAKENPETFAKFVQQQETNSFQNRVSQSASLAVGVFLLLCLIPAAVWSIQIARKLAARPSSARPTPENGAPSPQNALPTTKSPQPPASAKGLDPTSAPAKNISPGRTSPRPSG